MRRALLFVSSTVSTYSLVDTIVGFWMPILKMPWLAAYSEIATFTQWIAVPRTVRKPSPPLSQPENLVRRVGSYNSRFGKLNKSAVQRAGHQHLMRARAWKWCAAALRAGIFTACWPVTRFSTRSTARYWRHANRAPLNRQQSYLIDLASLLASSSSWRSAPR